MLNSVLAEVRRLASLTEDEEVRALVLAYAAELEGRSSADPTSEATYTDCPSEGGPAR